MNIRRDASELYFCLAFVISKSSVSKVSVPSSKRRVADVHGSRESCHAIVIVKATRFFGATGVCMRHHRLRRLTFLDRLSRGNPDWSERCETRGGWIDGVAK